LYGFLTWKSNYCFICTWYYSNTIRITGKRYFIFIGFGVIAVKDKIYIGGKRKVLILNTDGSRVREITADGGYNYNLLYDERNDQLLIRQPGRLCCINLDGHVIYRYDISGYEGLAIL
jgi:Tol biopolymer transport system component